MAKRISNTTAAQFATTEINRLSIETVSHVAHFDAANSIARDGKILANLVSDESILKQKTVHVVWLSPNVWRDGSRYGCIGFSYDLASLLKDKQLYWVEAMDYGVTACRILVTDKIPNELKREFAAYSLNEPGPLTVAEGKYWFNSAICLELMIESSLPLAEVRAVSLVDHHRDYCAINRSQPCTDRNSGKNSMGRYFVSKLLATKNKYLNEALKREGGIDLSEIINKIIESICDNINFDLSRSEHAGDDSLVSLFSIYSQHQDDSAEELAQLGPQLPSEENLKCDMLNFANKHFDLS